MGKGIRKAALEATTGEQLFEFIKPVLAKMEGVARLRLKIWGGAEKSSLGLQPLLNALQKHQQLFVLDVLYKFGRDDGVKPTLQANTWQWMLKVNDFVIQIILRLASKCVDGQ